eukprot:1652793-Heterocapsa_arctica.AAC.1
MRSYVYQQPTEALGGLSIWRYAPHRENNCLFFEYIFTMTTGVLKRRPAYYTYKAILFAIGYNVESGSGFAHNIR